MVAKKKSSGSVIKDIEVFEFGGGSFGGAGAGGSWDDVLDGLDILAD